jgi:H+/Cl- antiporter ClcA
VKRMICIIAALHVAAIAGALYMLESLRWWVMERPMAALLSMAELPWWLPAGWAGGILVLLWIASRRPAAAGFDVILNQDAATTPLPDTGISH